MLKVVTLAGLVLLITLPARAQQASTSLTLEEALERARELSPSVAVARLRVGEARGRLVGASLVLPTNPTVEVDAGRRTGQESTTDYGLEVAQELDLPQRRRARVDSAQAAVAQAEFRTREVDREVLREVSAMFFRALEARDRVEAATASNALAGEALRIAQRRYAAGDVAQLDVNLARTAVARAGGEARIAAATLTGYATRLQVLLGIAEPVTVSGSLSDTLSFETTDLLRSAASRSDVGLLDAEIVEAEAEQRLARMLRWPDFGLRGSFRREENDRIVLAGIGMSLPIFNRGQEATAVGNARLARLRLERETLIRTIEVEVRGAVASFEAQRAAADEYHRTVLPLVEENERLALESYEAGQIGLTDLLLVRREAVEARRALIDQLIDTRLAEVDLRSRTGVWK